MGERWRLSRRELAAWVAIVLLVLISIGAWRPEAETVRVVHPPSSPSIADSPARLDLNQATEEELQLLPGIGVQRARQIVAFRRQHGAFRCVDQLAELPGFSRALVERIAPMLTIASGLPLQP